jgi:hypothetical protein
MKLTPCAACLLLAIANALAAEVKQTTLGDCSPALAYVTGNVEIRCQLDSRELKQLAATVMQYQRESKARNYQTEALVDHINKMLMAVTAAQQSLQSRVEGRTVDIAEVTKLILDRLRAAGVDKADVVLQQTKSWPSDYGNLRKDWQALNQNDIPFRSAYEPFVLGQITKASDVLESELRNLSGPPALSAQGHYLLGRLYELEYRPALAFKQYQDAWRLDSTHVEYVLGYARGLQQQGALGDATKQYEAAITMLRVLAVTSPERYRPVLAVALKNLALVCLASKQSERAESAYREARDLFRQLVTSNPEVFAPDLAVALSQLGLFYGDARRYREAESTLSAADETYRLLVDSDRLQYEPRLIENLLALAALHSRLGRDREVDADLAEAEERSRSLVRIDPVAFGPLLANTMYGRGRWLGRNEEAINAYRIALDALKEPVNASPSLYEGDLADVLRALGLALWSPADISKVVEALENLARARDIYARLAKANPDVFEPKLGEVLRDLGDICIFTRRYDEANIALQQAKEVWTKLAKANPAQYQRSLRRTEQDLEDLSNLSGRRFGEQKLREK